MKKKVFVSIISVFLISLFILNNDNFCYKIKNSIEVLKLRNTQKVQRLNNYNKMKIDYINLKSRVTGTEPFNKEVTSNEYGVDVSETDEYVRTFDLVKYVLEIGISPNTSVDGVTESSSFRGGIIKVRAKLPNQKEQVLMTWEEDAWMQNISYNADKTEIYAEYHVSNNVDITNANQSLSFTIRVNGYKKPITKEMSPEFEVWMDGNNPDNNDSTIKSIKYHDSNKLIISAKPSYDVDLKSSTYLYSGKKDETVGEYISYGIGVSLVQPYSYIKDLRGVEFPTGKFEVDIKNDYLADNGPNQEYQDITKDVVASLIAYSVNSESNKNYYFSKSVYTRTLPRGLGGGDKGVTNSGNISASFNDNTTTISFENYVLDNKYPIRNMVTAKNKISYEENTGYIMAGNVQLFVPFYDSTSENLYNYKYNAKVSNIRYYDSNKNIYEISGDTDQNTSNNTISINFKKTNSDSFYIASSLNSNNTDSRDGLASALIGETISPQFTLMPTTGPYDSAERLITWNVNYFELVPYSKNETINVTCTSELGHTCPSKDTFTIKYGIYKENNNGLTNDDIVSNAYFDDFNWYDTEEEAKKHGTITAIYGLDNEVIGKRVHRVINPKFKIVDNKELIGKVGMIVHRVKVYDTNKEIIYEPYKNKKYTKTAYNAEGILVKGQSSYNVGLSVLVLGSKTGVETTVTDTDLEGNIKNVYNVTDKNINIKIVSKLVNDYLKDKNEYSTSVIIKSILPKGLSYQDKSANKTPKDIIYNQDGTTTIIWEYNNWQINSKPAEYPEITYKADINSSISNNTMLTITSSIYDKSDLREIRYRSSDYTVYISNLSGSVAFKEISKTTLDVKEAFSITNTIGNISEAKLLDVWGFEILPKASLNSSYKIEVENLSDKQKLYYTTKNINDLNITEDINGKKIITTFKKELWNEIQVGEIIPEDATALLTIIDTIDSYESISYKYSIIPSNNKVGDKYTFSTNITSANLITAVKTNTVVAEVSGRTISGVAFTDNNSNELYDTEDELLKDISVNIYDENNTLLGTTKTDNSGNYSFNDLTKGNYYLEFNIPRGYIPISIGDNKADISGKTAIINHNSERIINNINLGIKRKKVKVITHYYYENTKNSISTDVNNEYYYGDYYETILPTDIPINYELKTVTDNRRGFIDKDIIEVIYYYRMKDSIITDNINKSGTESINNGDDIFEYKLLYNVNIKNYIGNFDIIIKETLPFDIDISESNLDGGIYNSNDKTITWIKTINDVDAYTNEYNTHMEKNIKIVYKGIDLNNDTITTILECKTVLSNNLSTKNTFFATKINNSHKNNNVYKKIVENTPITEINEVTENEKIDNPTSNDISNKHNKTNGKIKTNKNSTNNKTEINDEIKNNISNSNQNIMYIVSRYLLLIMLLLSLLIIFIIIIFYLRRKDENEKYASK